VDKLGVFHVHQFGEGHLRVLIFQEKHRRLNNFGGNIMQSLSNGGATGLTRGISGHLAVNKSCQDKHFWYIVGQHQHV